MTAMKSFSLVLSNANVAVVKTDPSVRLYQRKFDGPNKVRFFTNKPYGLAKDLAKVINQPECSIQKQMGLLTEEEKARALMERLTKEQKRVLKRQINLMLKEARSNGIDVSDLI